jgi:uncharacterized protein (DUF58 family)
LLTAAELTLLSRLDLAYRRSRNGLYAGERRSPRAARSPEFSDFRPYVSGDDFRQIDWRAYARLERLMLRLYVAEEEACLNVVLDASESMALGTPPKWPSARRLAAALAFLGLAAMDRVTLGTFDGRALPPLRGRDGVGRMWQFLEGLEPAGETGPAELARLRWLRPGMTVVVSDFMAADAEGAAADWAPALAALAGRRQEPVLWQVLAPDEERPSITGDLRLVDPETGRDREITITPAVVADYERSLAAFRSRLARSAQAAGGRFLVSDSAADLEQAMLAGLKAGVLRRG